MVLIIEGTMTVIMSEITTAGTIAGMGITTTRGGVALCCDAGGHFIFNNIGLNAFAISVTRSPMAMPAISSVVAITVTT